MIILKNVSKSYNGRTKAVDDISLEVNDGEIFGFIGPNGAGKTTTLKMMTGIISPDSGEINMNGFDIMRQSLEAKRSFGFVSDDPNTFLRLKGIEYLSFLADIYNVPKQLREQRVDELAHKLEMKNALGDRIQNYSHGMRQKIMLIGALIHNPPVWILDEPMTGLDPKSSFVLKEMMKEHTAAGKTVLFSTHVLEVAEKICDRIAIIDNGKIICCGRLEDLKRNAEGDNSLEHIFLGLTGQDE